MLVLEQGEGLWGAQRYLLRLAPLLADRGFTCVLAAPQQNAISTAWQDAGFEHVHIPVPDDRKVRRSDDDRPHPALIARELARTAEGAGRVVRAARATRADLISANSHWAHLEGALAGRLARIPTVLNLHEQSLPGVAGRLRAASVRIADATIAVSHAVAGDLPPKTRSRVHVIHNGIDATAYEPGPADPDLRAEIGLDPKAPVVLLMNRLDPHKGVDDAIRAVAALPEPFGGVQLAIAGGGSLDPSWAATLHQLGATLLGERVRFLGVRSDGPALLNASDVFVLASQREGLPLGILEAQASGTPVLAYPASGVPEVVEDGKTGLLARQGDVTDLARQLERLLADAGLRQRLAERARRQVLEEFTLARQADRIADVLRSLVRS